MNYGAEPADQLVHYYLEGSEYAIKLTGSAAKNFAVFALAVLKDQRKTHGKTNLVRLLREGKPLKFFSVPAERMSEFAHEAKIRGLLYVPIKDGTEPEQIEIAVLAEDAAKVNRVIDRMQLDVVDVGGADIIKDVEQDRAEMAAAPAQTQTVDTPAGPVAFEVGESEDLFGLGFTPAAPAAPVNGSPSATSLNRAAVSPSSAPRHPLPLPENPRSRPSVREELKDIAAMLRLQRRGQPQIPAPKRPIKINRTERMM